MLAAMLAVALLPGCAGQLASTKIDEDSGAHRAEEIGRIAADIEARGETGTALTLYQHAASTSGDSAAAHIQLGDAYLRAGRNSAAVAAYRDAVARSPESGAALLGLGTALVRQGDLEHGLGALGRAAPLVKTAAAYNRLGVAQTLAGQLDAAQTSFSAASTQAPDDLDIRTNLALSAALAGQDEKAVPLMLEVVGSPHAELRHRRDLVIVLGLLGRGDEARGAAVSELSTREVQNLIARAGAIRAMADGKARAKALGAVMG
jgi:Flp pilus assembly protein TadD